MEKRSRAFQYTVDSPDESVLYQLHHIICEYHAYGYEENTIKGLIIFKHTKTEKAVSKLLQTPAYKIPTDSFIAMTDLKKGRILWEKGTPPKRIKVKNASSFYQYLMDQNRELIENIMDEKQKLQEENMKLQKELISTIHTPTSTTNDYSVNKKITNINLFLNTHCKDAISLNDFVDQLVIKEEDIQCMKTLGYVESVSQLLKRSLKGYEIHQRPIHCTDIKREVIHVKQPNGWNREISGEHPYIDRALRYLSHIHRKKMSDIYRSVEVDSNAFEEKAKLMYEISSACGSEEGKYNKKIIKNISENIRLTV
jgi:hypothetical protein